MASKEKRKENFKKKLAQDMTNARKNYEPKITQDKLAGLIEPTVTKQHVSNLENGNYFPTVDYLFEVAEATGKELVIEFKDK